MPLYSRTRRASSRNTRNCSAAGNFSTKALASTSGVSNRNTSKRLAAARSLSKAYATSSARQQQGFSQDYQRGSLATPRSAQQLAQVQSMYNAQNLDRIELS